MMRLIDADVANRWMEQNEAYIDAEILRAIPTVDAVPVTRCKDCKYAYINSFSAASGVALCSLNAKVMQQNDFCSYGNRKE
nr:MAG TPA: Protein transport protein Sec24B coat protein, vesicle transport.8A [Caudoviricetes sp.]